MTDILDAAALDDLEATGQAKRLVGRICAELHNAIRTYAWSVHGGVNDPRPPLLDESVFLPRRQGNSKMNEVRRTDQRRQADANLRNRMLAMTGF